MATALRMPQLGESVVEGTVGKWLKSVGESVDKYEPLLEVVTDKVDSEITSPDSGTVLQLYAAEGDTVRAGRLLAYIGQEGEPIPAPGSPEAMEIVAPHGFESEAEPIPPASRSFAVPDPQEPKVTVIHVSPVVARIVAEQDVNLSEVTGTGRDGRVTKKDIQRFIEMRAARGTLEREPGEKAFERDVEPSLQPVGAPGELLALTPMRKAIADHMVRSVRTSPHVSTVFELDASHIVAHCALFKSEYAHQGVKLTFTPYFVLAAVRALKAVPVVNSSFSAKGIQLKQEINIGIAVAMDEGLIVPVIKQADGRSLLSIARAVNDLAQRARNKQLKPDEVQGGTFTITNHGATGSLIATPIINQPQAAIMGVGIIQKRVVVVENDAIAVRPMAYVSLTVDHRILDGAVADRFLTVVKQTLEDWD